MGYFYRENMLSGDMLEFKSNSLIGRMIRCKTDKKVNHSSLIVKMLGRIFTLESLGSGIELHLLSNRVRDFNGKIYYYPLKDDFYRDAIAGWALDQIDKKYDYPGVFANLFGKVNVDGRLYFCSEYVQAAYKHAGLIKQNDKACFPGEFEKYNIHKERVRIK